jgi:lipopolysaccharide transport system ATP-binding protein
MKYRVAKGGEAKFVPNFHFTTDDGTYAFVDNAPNVETGAAGAYEAVCEVPGFLMNEGSFSIGIAVTAYFPTHHKVCFFERSALSIHITDPHDYRSNRYGFGGKIMGVVRPRFKWTVTETKN